MSWMGTGYDGIEKAWENMGGRGGQRRVWLPPNKSARFMFLDDDPTTLWEHHFLYNNSWKNWEPCLVRNKLGPACPICQAYDDKFPSFVGLHTVINMTPWFTKKGNQEVNFSREIYAAKLGGDKKPGVLTKLKKLKAKYGRLRGLVFNIERPGEQTEVCGSEFDLVESIEPKDIREYATKHLTEYVARANQSAPADKQLTIEQIWKRNPWEPFNFEQIIKPKSFDELKAMFARGTGGGSKEAGEGDAGEGEDSIPY